MNPDIAEIPAGNDAISAKHTERQSSGWDINNAPKNYIYLILFQIASAAFSFGAVWLITRRVGSEGYGSIVAVIAASQVAQVFVNWTSISVVRFGVDEFVETARIARTFWMRFVILFVNLTLVLSLAVIWFPPLADWLKLSPGAFWLVVIHFAVTAFWLHVQMSLQGAKMLRWQGFLQMCERLLIFAVVLALFVTNHLEFYLTVLCYIAAPAVMVVAGLVGLREFIFARFSFDVTFFKKILLYSVPLLPFTLVGYFSGSYVDAMFISKFLSTSDLGVYSIATQVNGIAMQIPTLANTILLPLLVTLRAESGDQRSFNYFRNVLPGITLLWGLACVLLSFIGYLLVPVIFGPKFAGAALPIWILLTASVVSMPVAIGYSALANSMSTTYVPMIAGVVSAAVNISANFILIPKYGMAGCAWATLIAYFAASSTLALLLKKTAKMPVSWTLIAIAPSIAGTIIICWWQNPAFGLAVCIAASFLVGFLFRESVNKSVLFIRNLRTARV